MFVFMLLAAFSQDFAWIWYDSMPENVDDIHNDKSMSNDRVLAEFSLDNNATILVEVPKPIDPSAVEEASILDETIYKSQETIEAALDKVTPIASAVMSRLKAGLTTPADSVEVKFGINLSVDSGVIISSIGGEVNFEVTLKWGK